MAHENFQVDFEKEEEDMLKMKKNYRNLEVEEEPQHNMGLVHLASHKRNLLLMMAVVGRKPYVNVKLGDYYLLVKALLAELLDVVLNLYFHYLVEGEGFQYCIPHSMNKD